MNWLELRVPRAGDLLRDIASRNGSVVNASAVGRRLGLSCHAVRHRLTLLEEAGIIRVLPLPGTRRRRVLLRDCRLLGDLGGSRLAILRTRLTERITAAPEAFCFVWETGKVTRIDLVAWGESGRVGFLITEALAPRRRDWAPLRLALSRGVITWGFLLQCGARSFVTARAVIALPVGDFLGNPGAWLACKSFQEAHRMVRRRNEAASFDEGPGSWYRAAHQ